MIDPPIVIPDNRDLALAGLRKLPTPALVLAIARQSGSITVLESILERGPSEANIRELLDDLRWGLEAAKDLARSRGVHLP